MKTPQPPPEAQLIAELREKPPKMSQGEAARRAGISPTRWRQIEYGVRHFRGDVYPEPPAPAAILAKMAHAVGATPEQLTERGRADAAGELAALLASPAFDGRQERFLTARALRDVSGEQHHS